VKILGGRATVNGERIFGMPLGELKPGKAKMS